MPPSEKLQSLGLTLPPVATPVGSYRPAVCSAGFIYTSGQLPMRDGELLYTGKLGRDVSLEQAIVAARQAGLNALAAAADAASGIDRIQSILRVNVFVASAEGFTDQPKVANGASDLFLEIFGDAGRHTRAALGVAELPLNAPVEIDLIAGIKN